MERFLTKPIPMVSFDPPSLRSTNNNHQSEVVDARSETFFTFTPTQKNNNTGLLFGGRSVASDRRKLKVCVIDRSIGNPSGIIFENITLPAINVTETLNRPKKRGESKKILKTSKENVSWKNCVENESCVPSTTNEASIDVTGNSSIIAITASILVSHGMHSSLRQNDNTLLVEVPAVANDVKIIYHDIDDKSIYDDDNRAAQAWHLFASTQQDSPSSNFRKNNSSCLINSMKSQPNSHASLTDYFIGHSAH